MAPSIKFGERRMDGEHHMRRDEFPGVNFIRTRCSESSEEDSSGEENGIFETTVARAWENDENSDEDHTHALELGT